MGEKKLIRFLIFDVGNIKFNCLIDNFGSTRTGFAAALANVFNILLEKIKSNLASRSFIGKLFRRQGRTTFHLSQYTALYALRIYSILSGKVSDKSADKIYRTKDVERALELA